MNDVEIWKPIKGYEENYLISSYGNIKNVKRNKLLKLEKKRAGYLCVNLWKNNKQKTFNVHRLVALTFLPNPKNKLCVDHINGCKWENNIENLQWVTHKENIQNAFTNNFINCSKNAKLTSDDVINIRKLYSFDKFSLQQLSDMFNTTPQNISKIVNFETWKYMPLAQKVK